MAEGWTAFEMMVATRRGGVVTASGALRGTTTGISNPLLAGAPVCRWKRRQGRAVADAQRHSQAGRAEATLREWCRRD
ncbi:MAG: hypothetical protein QOJ37_1808 [Pseudonocardiales bacterium]|nr:hypothetical protein [Pseudonocardiales bacterium]